jgi:hypothetical protein
MSAYFLGLEGDYCTSTGVAASGRLKLDGDGVHPIHELAFDEFH